MTNEPKPPVPFIDYDSLPEDVRTRWRESLIAFMRMLCNADGIEVTEDMDLERMVQSVSGDLLGRRVLVLQEELRRRKESLAAAPPPPNPADYFRMMVDNGTFPGDPLALALPFLTPPTPKKSN